jgi:hypothetical protein
MLDVFGFTLSHRALNLGSTPHRPLKARISAPLQQPETVQLTTRADAVEM